MVRPKPVGLGPIREPTPNKFASQIYRGKYFSSGSSPHTVALEAGLVRGLAVFVGVAKPHRRGFQILSGRGLTAKILLDLRP